MVKRHVQARPSLRRPITAPLSVPVRAQRRRQTSVLRALHCLAMASATPCSQQISEFYACLAVQPAARWQCDNESGVAQIREGFCEKEQAQSVSCMETKMNP